MSVRSLVSALALLVAACLVLPPAPVSAREAVTNTDAKFSTEELDQILAPIALYPDDLLSNVLMAATYPLEVVQAARWIAEPENADLKGAALTKALEDKDWDPSVKALTQFPDVLAMMSEQLDWTQKLGDAFIASEADVMDRIQHLRDKAEEAGNLKSNEHQTVTTRSVGGDDYIYIEPADPEIVYVPVYDPLEVYGPWWYPDYPPYYWWPDDVVYVNDFFWGTGVVIAPSLWAWSRPRWHRHYIHIDRHKFNRLERHRRKLRSGRWRHNAHHRRGVKFKGAKAWRKTWHPKHGAHRKRIHLRHHDDKRVLKPGGKRTFKSNPDKRTFSGPRKRNSAAPVKRKRSNVKRSSGAGKKHRVIRAKKRSSAGIKKRSRKSFSKSRRRSSVKRFSRGGRSGFKARGGGRRAGFKRGGGRSGGHRGGGKRSGGNGGKRRF